MSFDYDPYAVMTIVLREDGSYSYLCDSCGGGYRSKFPPSASVELIRQSFDKHVQLLHKLTREQTVAWDKGFQP